MVQAKRLLHSTCRYLASRSFCYPLFLMAVTAVLWHTVMTTNAVRVVDGLTEGLVYTTQQRPSAIVAMAGIKAPSRNDMVHRQGEGGYIELSMERAFPVFLTVDGDTRRVMTTTTRLDEMLTREDVTLGQYDLVNKSLGYQVRRGDSIIIQRVEQTLVEEENPIPFTIREKPTSLLRAGRTRVLQEGRDGTEVRTYRQVTVDGRVQERELIATDVVRRPIEQVVLVDDGSPISNFDFSDEFPLDANGIPLHYDAVFHNQIATGYWARDPIGASRMRCQAGTAAVRSSQFPYGTKLYVRTAEGDFIYGYTVTNDTGVGLMQNIIDIDLYYETYAESALNGRRIVDIYVLEYAAHPTSSAIRR